MDLMADVVLHLVVHLAALERERLLDRLDEGQRLVGDAHQPGRAAGDLLRLGGHDRDDVAIEADLVVADDGVVVQVAHTVAGHVAPGIDLHAAGQLQRLGRIDRQDARVRLRGEHRHGIQHGRQNHVRRKLQPSGDLCNAVEAPERTLHHDSVPLRFWERPAAPRGAADPFGREGPVLTCCPGRTACRRPLPRPPPWRCTP